ncbi:MmgE/PrpD family protein [Rhodovulum sp. 12E13]|uniref:MmgE/PrpD family protein n=1 Tax=Rhodovulum sp. 12E13 TaxID=2203891 RepID=UPI000E13B1F7|nr:MmgE/PrpD family protein [Rhodovulum sp. 12E13]RDC73083.1 MmgE/PrpD family protein [Rhodovulum sp. 12E13]
MRGPAHAADERGAQPGLAARLAGFACRAVPTEAALATMRLSLFDWAACAIAGAAEPAAAILRAQAEAEGGAGQASLAGSPAMRVPARAAALVNGAASHALDYDDTQMGPVVHPSVAVLPAALAVAERQGAGGAEMLHAALVGAEVMVRLGLWLGPDHPGRGFHPTATCGAFGAAVAAGLLGGLDAGRMEQALAIAATRAAGLQAVFGSMGKPLNAGTAAAAGLEAADLAAAGFTCPPAALDGPQGFGPAHGGAARPEALLSLDARWEMARVSHKLHACCHGLHAMLEALAGLDLPASEIDRVTVRTHPRWLAVCDDPAPTTGLEAKFSYRLTGAMALAGRDTGDPATFSAAACAEPALVRLRDRIDVVGDRALPETATQVDVTARGGATTRLVHDIDTPLPPERLRRRLEAKASALAGAERAAILAAATLADVPDIAQVGGLLREAAA